MTITILAFCFASGVLGAVVGVGLVCYLTKPRLKFDVTVRSRLKCAECDNSVLANHEVKVE